MRTKLFCAALIGLTALAAAAPAEARINQRQYRQQQRIQKGVQRHHRLLQFLVVAKAQAHNPSPSGEGKGVGNVSSGVAFGTGPPPTPPP